MKTLTMNVDPADAPVGAFCRVYHSDDNAFVAETVSDGSGVLVFSIDDQWAAQMQLNVYVNGVEGGSLPVVASQSIV